MKIDTMQNITLCIPVDKIEKVNLDKLSEIKKDYKEIILVIDNKINLFSDLRNYPFRIIEHKENKGIAFARNTALLSSDTEFIAFLDSDCFPEENWLHSLLKYFEDSKVAGVSGKVIEANTEDRPDFWRSVHMQQHWGDKVIINPPFLYGANGLYRKEALLDIGLYNEKYKTNYEDVDISKRLKQKGWKLIYTPEAVVYHLRKDNLNSLLRTFWRWNFYFYEEKKLSYRDLDSIIEKLEDNFGRTNLFIEEDFKENRFRLLYIDFILPIALSLFDFCFILDKPELRKIFLKPDKLASFLSLFEVSYLAHANSNSKTSLIKKNYTKEQNIILFLIQIGKILKERSDLLWRKVIKDLCSLIWDKEKVDYQQEVILKQVNSNYSFNSFFEGKFGYLITDWLRSFFDKLEEFLNWINQKDKKIIDILNA